MVHRTEIGRFPAVESDGREVVTRDSGVEIVVVRSVPLRGAVCAPRGRFRRVWDVLGWGYMRHF